MKIFIYLLIYFVINNCSFDNKTGIWQNTDKVTKKDEQFIDFKNLSYSNNFFNETIKLKENFTFRIFKKIKNTKWTDFYYNKSNNFINFDYNESNNLIYKSKKITRSEISKFILYYNDNIIISDAKGNIIVFSITQKKLIQKFNFYKKKYKNIKKILNIILENNVIYVSDNLGYLYAYDYIKDEVLWAKNYKVPFRSNIKLLDNMLITSNLNNNFYYFDKKNGSILKMIPTEETKVKNEFLNNLSINEKDSYFLNTYGSLYSISNSQKKINWFLNLNQSLDLNPSNLFSGNQVVSYNDKIVVSSNIHTYILSKSGLVLHKKNFSSHIKPIINNNYIFVITKKNLLVAIDINNGKIIYSYDINKKIADFLNVKKKKVKFKNIILINNKIFIFLENSYVIKFSISGEIIEVVKLPSKINSNPILINGSLLYLSTNNKIIVVN